MDHGDSEMETHVTLQSMVDPKMQAVVDEIVAKVRAYEPPLVTLSGNVVIDHEPIIEPRLTFWQRVWLVLNIDVRDVWKRVKTKFGGKDA